ncbi:MAG: zinc-dependent metalloprotease [Balneolaceae bacterium]
MISNTQAQDPGQREFLLFEYEDREEALEKMSADDPEGAYIRLSRELEGGHALNKGDLLRFELKGGVQHYRVSRTTRHIEFTLSVRARSVENPEDYLLVTFSEGRMTGMMYARSHSEHYHFNYDRQKDATYIVEKDPRSLGDFECAVDSDLQSESMSDPDAPGEPGRNKSGFQDSGPPRSLPKAMAASPQDSITLDVMVAYTRSARQWAETDSQSGSIQSLLAEAMDLAEFTLYTSFVAIKLRLVHIHETDYDESAGDAGMSDHLQRFASSPGSSRFGDEHQGYMDEVHDLRDEYGADLMMLLVNDPTPTSGGIGFILRRIEGEPELGFSVSNIRALGRSGVFIHEIGHNLGNAHSRDQKEAAAGARGGIFEYSTGYRFLGSDNEGREAKFATIMSYSDDGEYRIVPRFSGPEVLFHDTPTGSYDPPWGPSDNSRSMQVIKRVVSNYRQPQFEPPSASVSQGSLTFNLGAEQTRQVPVFISNEGESDLIYDIDFKSSDLPPTLKPAAKPSYEVFILRDPVGSSHQPLQNSFSTDRSSKVYSDFDTRLQSNHTNTNETLLYQTTFSSGEGYSPGNYVALNQWRTYFGTDHTFEISRQNPASGTGHLRIHYLESLADSTTIVRSPYFGLQPFGAYEFTADIALHDNGREDARFDLYLWDSRGEQTDFMTAGVIFTSGSIFVRSPSGEFIETAPYDAGDYRTLRIVTDPASDKIRYYYDGTLIRSTPFISGITFGHFWLLHQNQEPDTWIDIDNIEVRRPYAPFGWLNMDSFGGVVKPGETGEAMLGFSTFGIRGGRYDATMVIHSNDPNRETVEIPIQLNVDLVIPDGLSMEQNFPNPFQQTTTIEFGLPEPSHVILEVYSVTGQRVKTIVNETRPAGTYYIPFDPADLASGVYIYRLRTEYGNRDHKMVFIK